MDRLWTGPSISPGHRDASLLLSPSFVLLISSSWIRALLLLPRVSRLE